MTDSQPPTISSREYAGLVFTNLVKLAGVVLGMAEAFTHDEVRPLVIGFAGLLVAGGQAIESFFTSLFQVRR